MPQNNASRFVLRLKGEYWDWLQSLVLTGLFHSSFKLTVENADINYWGEKWENPFPLQKYEPVKKYQPVYLGIRVCSEITKFKIVLLSFQFLAWVLGFGLARSLCLW